MPKTETLAILGYREEPVPHTFFRQQHSTTHLAVLLPGLGYNAYMPLFYYTLQLLLARNADVLRVETAYNHRPDYLALNDDDQHRWIKADAIAACQAGLAQRRYRNITLIGKSLGTLAMQHVLASKLDLPGLTCVWLTPILTDRAMREAIRSVPQHALFVIGSSDPYYNPDLLREVEMSSGGESLVIRNADHSLELRGDVLGSLREMEKVIERMAHFLDSVA